MFLKDCSHEGVKKWNFFKSKPCIANPYDRKLDMVPYFTPLVMLDPKSKIEKQVSFFVDLPNAFFKLVRQPTFQKWILWSNFRLFKKIWNLFWRCRMVENDCLGPGGCFGTALDQLGWIRNVFERIQKKMFETSIWANFLHPNFCSGIPFCTCGPAVRSKCTDLM